MKNNYNPFTVPDSFFENVRVEAVSKFQKRNRAVRYGIAAALLAAVVVVVPTFFSSFDNQVEETAANSLANMYEYDIFLQVNF